MASANVHDVELEHQINEVRDRWNAFGGSTLHLFKNNFVPGPQNIEDDFTEADFDGYAAVGLTGDWSAVVRVEEGHYEMHTTEHQYDAPGEGAANTIYGAYIVHDGEVVHSKRFDNPILMEVGSLPFKVRVTYTQKAESILA